MIDYSEQEEYLKTKIFSDLKKGDPNWDIPHTKAVVHYVKEIIQNEPDLNLDYDVLVTAAYGHDWGYVPYYKKGHSLSREEYLEAKKKHMDIGVSSMKSLLGDDVFNILSDKQMERILHLIAVHDKIEELGGIDELVLMEADTLGGLDVSFVKPSFSKEENAKHMKSVLDKRRPKFITDYGKKMFDVLYKKRGEHYKNK